MSFFKKKPKNIGELISKFSLNIKNTRDIIKEGRDFSESYFESDSALVDALEQNFTRLIERYKFDEKKVAQILFDSLEYTNIIDDSVTYRGIEHSEYDEKMKPLWLKLEEISLRFKNLLGEQYVDPIKLIENK